MNLAYVLWAVETKTRIKKSEGVTFVFLNCMWAHPVFIAKCARERWGTPSFKNVTPSLICFEIWVWVSKFSFSVECCCFLLLSTDGLARRKSLEKHHETLKAKVLSAITIENPHLPSIFFSLSLWLQRIEA